MHSAIDAHTRLAYSEIQSDERGLTCAGLWTRANAFLAEHGIKVEAVLSDNAKNYLGRDFTAALASAPDAASLGSRPAAGPGPRPPWITMGRV